MKILVAPDKFKGSLTRARRRGPGRGRDLAECRRPSRWSPCPSPTAATARWTPRSAAGFARVPVTRRRADRRAGATPATRGRTASAVVELADVVRPGPAARRRARAADRVQHRLRAGHRGRAGRRLPAARAGASAAAPAPTAAPACCSALGARLLDADGRRRAGRAAAALERRRPGRPVRPAPGAGRRRGRAWPATSTTRCSATTAPPRCTGRRRARPRTTWPGWTARCGRWAGAVARALAIRTASGTRPRTSPAPARPAGSASPRSPCWAPPPGPGIDLMLDLVGFADAPGRRRPGDHRGGVAGRADPARQGPGRRRRRGPRRRGPGGRGRRPEPVVRAAVARRRASGAPTRSPTSSPTCSGA